MTLNGTFENKIDKGSHLGRLLYWAAVCLLMLLSIGGNLYWISRNVVLIGRDAGGHLTTSLQQAEILRQPSLQSFLMALSFDDYRPPAFYLFAQPSYALFGYSADAAQLQNVLWLAVILGLTFFYGQFYNPFVALVALALTAFLPMLAGMTRMFYTEAFITAMVVLNLLALLQSKGFAHRGWALIWGASAGLGLLVKWTFPVYVLLPVLFVIWPMVRDVKSHSLTMSKGDNGFLWRRGGVSVAIAGAVTALLVLTSHVYIGTLILGQLIFVIWFGLMAAAAFVLQVHSSPWSNLTAAILLLLLIASVWYLTRIEFATALFDAAYGTYGGRRSQGFNLFDLRLYTRNWIYLWRMHLGPLVAVLLLPAVVAWVTDLWHWRTLATATRLLWGSVASLLFFTFAAQGNERNLVPLLPILALLAAIALLRFPKPWRIGLASVWVLTLALQWATLTFDALEPFAEATAPLWVDGEYAVRPASGETHPDFWIAPDVLARVAQSAPEGFPASLGILVNSKEIHRGPFRYLVSIEKLPVEVRTLGEIDMESIGEVFANQWVLIKDGDNRDVEAPGRAAIARLLAGDRLFEQLYTEETRYALPNGETVWLYRRIDQPGHPFTDPQMLHAGKVVTDHINRWWSDDAALLIPNRELATWVGISGLSDALSDAPIVIGDQPDAVKTALQDASVVFAVFDPYSQPLRDTLEQAAVRSQGVGDEMLSLAVYGQRSDEALAHSVAQSRDGTEIAQVVAQQQMRAGQVLVLELAMQGNLPETRRVSLRVVDGDGNAFAQSDRTVAETVTAGLLIPPDTAPGSYALVAILYDLPDMAPLTEGEAPPEIKLMEIEVE